MKWTQIRTECRADDLERVSAAMSMLDSRIMIEDQSDIRENCAGYGELIDEELLMAKNPAVSVFLSEQTDAGAAAEELRARFASCGIDASVTLRGCDDEDWKDSWKKYYHPISIGESLVIVPEWETETYVPAPGAVVVSMDPGMAFGSGTHETTRLVATLLEKHLHSPADGRSTVSIIDIGTGSGILAISAALLAASRGIAARVDAYDIDPAAVRVASENALRNGAGVNCAQSDLLDGVNGVYDLALANITADILTRMTSSCPSPHPSARLADHVRSGGLAALSGIINTQGDRVRAAMEADGFEIIDELHDNDWIALLCRKK